MAERSKPGKPPDHTASSLGLTSSFVLRASTAMAAAVVIGILVFDEKGDTVKKEKIFSPELVSFLCRYSFTLFGVIMDKLIEKVKKVIEVL